MAESQNIEWKQSWHDDYLKWICGFANAFGGKIYIGKNDSGDIVHVKDAKKLLEDIPSKIHNYLGIICDVNLFEEKAAQYIEIIVPPYSVPVSLRGRYYYRTGSTKVELSGNTLNEFLLKKAGKTWDEVIEERATINDIDLESVNRFLFDAQKIGRMPEVEGLSTMEIFEKLRLIDNGNIKRAAIILFGKDPLRFYPNFFVKIGRFSSDSDIRFQEVLEGNLITLQHSVVEMLFNKFIVKNITFEGMLRVETSEYPIIALREMVLNALVHRTYMGAMPQLRVYDDKITLWNEGSLPPQISIDTLDKNHISVPRNPLIADMCFKAGYIDSWGRGTIKIYEACAEDHLPIPNIEDIFGGIMVTLYKKEQFFNKESQQISTLSLTEFDSFLQNCRKEFGVSSHRIKLSEKENALFLLDIYEIFTGYLRDIYGINKIENNPKRLYSILILIILEPNISQENISKILKVSLSTIEKDIKQLQNKGIVQREGSRKVGTWIIINQ